MVDMRSVAGCAPALIGCQEGVPSEAESAAWGAMGQPAKVTGPEEGAGMLRLKTPAREGGDPED